MPVADQSSRGGRVVVAQQNNNNNNNAKNNHNTAPDLDPNDPRVKKLVYTMYRDMLTTYSDEATAFINQQDPALVTRDDGVLPIIETILRGGSSSGGAAQGAAPPPPPPMAPPGAIPPVRLNSEIGPRDKGPPAALAGAMMKDKKPFTYTPGGIDLSEIRSPRMAKRLQMNAAAEGVTSAPKPVGGQQQQATSPSSCPLPPAAMAAMQPQMAFCVFPQGAAQTLNRTPKPLDYTDGSGEVSARGGISNGNKSGPPPPPPPPPMMAKIPTNNTSAGPASSPAAMQMQLHAELLARVPTQNPPTPPTMAACPQFPPPPVKAKTPPPPPQNYPYEDEIRRPLTNNNVGQGRIYIQPISSPPPVQQQQQQQIPRNQQQHHRQAQNKAQNLGSIYIPPIEQQVSSPTYTTPSPSTAPSSAGLVSRTPPQPQAQAPPPPTQAPPSMQTPQLKKTPTPWMNSYNKMATKQAESPPYVNPANISTPWGTLGGSQPAPPPPSSQIGGGGGGAGVVFTIPIAMAQREDPQLARGGGAVSPEQSKAKAAQHLGRVIPIQIQRQESLNKEHQIQAEQERGWPTPRTIPIQVETRSGGQTPTGGMKKGATPSTYNNPIGLYSGQNAADAYKQQTGDLASGVNNVTIADQAEREPVQSKSMRVIQKVAENVDDGSFLHNTAEPRFLGGHIPSKAFKTLQTTLPSDSAGGSSTAPPARTTNKVQLGGPVMHNIPIQMSSTSPTPPSDRVPSPVPPSEQRALSPKKYMGSNIPSRSFKMLQAMTGPDQDADAPDASSSSSDTNIASSGCGGGGGGPSPSSPCPSIYLSWHYWWYYVTCYWAGYDMTGYDYPEGWDPENPYFPPELAGTLADGSSSYFDVPQIVVENGNDEFCDSNEQHGGQTIPESMTEKYVENKQCDDETEDEDVKFCHKSDNYGWMSASEEDGDLFCNTPIIEEPSSSSTVSTLTNCNSEDSDAATIVDEVMSPSSLMLIEEYFSSSESEAASQRPTGGKHVLSTIEELTDESRGSTPRSRLHQQQPEQEMEFEEEEVGQEIEEEEEEESPSEDEASSVSVIENKSASQSQQSVSKREDETSSSSSSEEEEEEEEDGDDENEPVAVTVRLPLKLCFGKTKSYKDITTVLVGDVDVGRQEEEDEVEVEEEEKVDVEKVVTQEEEKVKDVEEEEDYEWRDDEGDDDDEPVVSFTISLSRQTSRDEEKVQPEEVEEKVDDTEVEEEEEQEEDVDFWSKIIGPSTTNKKTVNTQDVTVVDDYWGSFGTSGEPVVGEEEEESKQEFQPVDDFWGTAATGQDDDEQNNEPQIEPPEEVNDPPATTITINLGKSTSSSKIGTSWDTEFNFWDKSLRTIETRRFSGNFEISEDYESDSGMKSDSGQRHRRHRVKKYKKHSVPVGLPVLRGRQSSRSLKLDSRPTPFSFVWETESKNKPSPKSSPPRNSPEIGANFAGAEAEEQEVEEEEEEVVEESVPTPATDDDNQQGDDLSVGWSFWDSIMDRNNTTTTTTGNDADDFSPDVDVQISLPLPVDSEETYQEQGEEEEGRNTVEAAEEEINVEIEEEKVVAPPERKLSDGTEENSEDSSKSSGTTVKGVTGHEQQETNSDESFKSSVAAVAEVEIEEEEDSNEEQHEEEDLPEAVASPEDETPPDFKEQIQPVTKPEETIRPLEIQELSESMKLSKDHQGNSCTCHIDSQLSRAESLLWRIERFLHESLSLGSEDDSGVMTDLSRPISDVDTDPDEQNSNDLLLTTNNSSTAAATAISSSSSSVVVTRRQTSSSSRSLREQAASNRANPNNISSPRRPRPQSLIMLESSTSRAEFQDTVTKPRSRSAERKRYQRAKTHSRLFQLLQDESSFRDEDDAATDDEFFDCEQQFVSSKTPLSFLHNDDNEAKSSPEEDEPQMDTPTTTTTQLQLHVDTSTRRSRLPPLPLKSILLNSNSTEMATTSNSSPSGSSGVLSPTSPQTRDRLLADIINEFHLRQKSDSNAATTTTSRRVSFSQPGTKRFSKFPSKIFKLLQEEFGEEFYQTFELGEIGGKLSPGELLSQSHFSLMSAAATSTTCQAHSSNDPVIACSSSSCSLVKSDSGKSTTSDFLEVPLPAPLLRRRDFRSPKSPFNKN